MQRFTKTQHHYFLWLLNGCTHCSHFACQSHNEWLRLGEASRSRLHEDIDESLLDPLDYFNDQIRMA